MDEQNLDRVSAVLRNIRKGEVNRPVSKEDIELQKRALPAKEVDEKVAKEKKQRQKEIEKIKKSEAETKLKKKIAEDSIKKLREGGVFDRKRRLEDLKTVEREFRRQEEDLEQGDSFEALLSDSQKQAESGVPADDDAAEFSDAAESEDTASSEGAGKVEEIASLEEEPSPPQETPTSFEEDASSFQQEDDSAAATQSSQPSTQADEVIDASASTQDEEPPPPEEEPPLEEEPLPDEEEYILDSGEEALPSLEEMNIEDAALDSDFWSRQDEDEVSQDANAVEEQPVSKGSSDEVPKKSKAPLSEAASVDTFIDSSEQDLGEGSEEQISDDDNAAAELEQPEQPDVPSFEDVPDEPYQSDVPIEINTDVALPVIDDLESFDKVEAQSAVDQLKKDFLSPLLKIFRHKEHKDSSLDDAQGDAFQDIPLEETDDEFATDQEDFGEPKEDALSEEQRTEQAESFLLDDDFDEAASEKTASEGAVSEGAVSEDLDEDLAAAQSREAEETLEEPSEPKPVARQAPTAKEEAEEVSLGDDFELEEPAPVFEKEPPRSAEPVAAKADKPKTSSPSSLFEAAGVGAGSAKPSPSATAPPPKEIDKEEVDRLLSETEIDEVSFDDITKNVKQSLSQSKGASDESLREDNYQKALAIINSYEAKNRKLIVEALTSNRISDQDADRISAMVLDGEDEQNVAAFVQNQIYQKTYRENLKEDLTDRNEEEEVVKQYQKKQRVLGFAKLIAATVLVAATAFFIVFYGIDMVRSEIAYRDSYANIEDRRYDIGEKRFEDAYAIMPSVRWINRIADLYIDRGLFLDAEKKYIRGLDFDPENKDVLNQYGEMLTFKGDYSRSYGKFREALKHHPGNIDSQKGLAENFIEWGIVSERRWVEGDKILSELVSQDSDNKLFYLSKKLEIASLRRNYPTSKFYYEKINELDEDYVDEKSLRRYGQFLINHYGRINTAIDNDGIDQNLRNQNNYIVATVQDIIKKVFEKNPNYLPALYTTASWFHVLDQDDKAMNWVRRGIEIIEKQNQPVVFRERFSPTHFYNLEGELFYEKGDFYGALESFQKSTDYNQNDAFANYYLGRIDLLEFNDLVKAEEKLGRAYINWDMERNDAYRDLLYSYGYVNYKQGRAELDQEKLERALGFWNQLLNDQQINDSWSVEFALSLTYLELDRYDLAQAFIDESIEDITPDLDYFQKTGGSVPIDVLERVKMLSDNYNNLGVVQASKALSERQRNRYINKQKAIEHFIDSITLKDELNLLKGVPYANFNRINNFPQVTEDFLLADSALPKTLLP